MGQCCWLKNGFSRLGEGLINWIIEDLGLPSLSVVCLEFIYGFKEEWESEEKSLQTSTVFWTTREFTHKNNNQPMQQTNKQTS